MQKPFYESLVCPECHIGKLRPTHTTYAHQYGETMITVQSVPAWRCDVCHICQFDNETLVWIETVIGYNGLPPNRYRPPVNARPARRSETISESGTAPEPAKARPKAK